MPEIKIGVNVNQTTTGGGGSGGKPGSAPAQNADAAAKLAAAQREAAKATGKAYSPEQMKIAADYFKEMSKSRNLLKSYNGDLERFIRDFRNNQPSASHGQKQFNSYMQQMGHGGANQPGGGIGGMVKQAVMGVFRATGMGGGTAGRIAGQGYHQAQEAEGGVASAGGMGMLARGAGIAALAYVGIKAVQKVGQKVGDAQDEATQYHDLRQSVGSTSVGFDELRESVRLFTNGLGIASGESAKLAKRYAESSQIYGTAAQHGIAESVGQGARLSRGFGLSPEAGVDFLATMRHFKASDGEKDNRKLAYLIGDAVGKTGAFSKADDVMNAIAHFTESTSRQSLQVANVEGYAGLMGALGGMKLPGMDAKGSASLMQQVAGNWANGGGEAGQNMRLGWAQRFGAGATDMGAIGDAGPWASAQSTFGEKSSLYKLAEGDKARQAHLLGMAQRGGDKTFYDHEIGSLKSQYSAEFLPMAMMGKYGVSDIGARSLLKAHESSGGIGGLQQRVASALSGTGKDPSKIGMQQMSMLSAIDQADSKELAAMRGQARKLSGKNALTGEESAALDGANTDDKLKQVLTQINAFRDVEDEGKTARQAQIDLDRKFQEFATKIIPLTNMIQEGIFKLVSIIPGGTSQEMKEFQRKKKLEEGLDKIKAGAGSDAEKAAASESLVKQDADEHMSTTDRRRALEASRKDVASKWAVGKGPRNLRNNNPGNIEYGEWAKAHGATGSDGRFAIFPDKASGSAAMDALLQGYSKRDGLNTVSGIVGKWAPSSENDTGAYSKGVAKRMGVSPGQTLDMSDPKVSAAIAKEMARIEGSSDAYIPAAARAPGAGGQAATVSGSARVLLQLPGGTTQDVDVPLTGGFRQTYAGEAR